MAGGEGEGVERAGGGKGVRVAAVLDGGEEQEREVVAREEAEECGEAVARDVREEGVEEAGGEGRVGGGEARGEDERHGLEEEEARRGRPGGDAETRQQGGDRVASGEEARCRWWGRHQRLSEVVAGIGGDG